jgi:hypothetical protein
MIEGLLVLWSLPPYVKRLLTKWVLGTSCNKEQNLPLRINYELDIRSNKMNVIINIWQTNLLPRRSYLHWWGHLDVTPNP